MTALANLFLIGFALDALVSLADELVRMGGGSELLYAPRQALASLAAVLAAPVAAALAVSPRLPVAVFAPPVAFIAWTVLGAYPAPTAFDSTATLGVALVGSQLALTALAFQGVRRRYGRWLLDDANLMGPAFRFERALRSALVVAVLLPPALFAYGALAAAVELRRVTAGFIALDATGVRSTTRVYERGDRRVTLVGMMHIGEEAAYRELFESFAGESTVVLEEGVTDDSHRLGDGALYDAIATRMGLDVQPRFEALREPEAADRAGRPWPDVVNADVDAADFRDETIELLAALGRAYRSEDFATALQRIQAASRELGPEETAIVLDDLIDRRNARVLDALDEALPVYRHVVVPWGALHMPGIESAVTERGFQQVAERDRRLIRYGTALRAVWRGAGAKGAPEGENTAAGESTAGDANAAASNPP